MVYSSRRQTDGLIEKIRETGNLDGITFGQKRDPCESVFQKMKTTFAPMFTSQGGQAVPDESNIAVTIAPNVPGFPAAENSRVIDDGRGPQVNNIVMFTDASGIKTIDPETLEPLGVTDQTSLHPNLKGPISCAHAHFDPVNGDVYNFNLSLGMSATYRLFKTSRATGKTEILATISDKDLKPAYLHSFFLTEDYMVVAIWPSYFASGGLKMLWQRNILDAVEKFDPKNQTKWLVVDRKQGRGLIAKFNSPAAFSFHTVNAWQEERDGKTDIYCDVVTYQNLDILHRLYYENLLSNGPGAIKYGAGANPMAAPFLTRYRLGGITSKVAEPSLSKRPGEAEVLFKLEGPIVGELPTINPLYSTRKTRYMYSMVDNGRSSWMDGIAKTDLETKKAIYWEHPHHTPGESIFVPDPNDNTEDAGFLLSVILDGDKGTSYLLCLDARTMKEVGRAECNVPVGSGFHGRHLPYETGKL